MLRRLVEALGVDYGQWRALVRAAVTSDLRGAGRVARGGEAGMRPLLSLLAINLVAGIFLAMVVAHASDLLFGATVVLTYAMFMVASLILMDFHAIVVSPDDFAILGFRPIASRTYFAARLTNVLFYTSVIAAPLGLPPVIAFAARDGFSPALGLAALLALYLGTWTTGLAMVVLYVAILRLVHPQRLRRALSYLQLALSFLVYGGLLAPRLVDLRIVGSMSLADRPWILVNPASWFASYLPIAAGTAAPWQLAGAVGSVLVLGLVVRFGAGRLSLEYSERLAGMMTSVEQTSGRRRKGRAARLPFFRIQEGRAVALLIQAQFRFDSRFRLGILTIVPLTAFYLVWGLATGSLSDPFAAADYRNEGASAVYFAAMLFPTLLHASLLRSDAYQASWVFFVTPAVRHRLVLAMKQFVTIYFLVPYLALLACFFAFFYERAWHAFVHVALVGLASHLVFQAIVLMNPGLPFSQPIRRGQRSASLWVVMLAIGVVTGVLPIVIALTYRVPVRLAAVFALLAVATLLMEGWIKRRVGRQSETLEFVG